MNPAERARRRALITDQLALVRRDVVREIRRRVPDPAVRRCLLNDLPGIPRHGADGCALAQASLRLAVYMYRLADFLAGNDRLQDLIARAHCENAQSGRVH